ncbi:MAG: polyketide synthase dehydratase domain-containing protein [Myxococcota bacterium]|jgi:3-hydroxymyristoyl/3-hydroxydecanoyl-(acyl carrier protein) dehydratase|nr:acyl-CoA synthetase [Deltaproteobacteria bacterium]MDP6076375.1 polyketide synthase dehydratase domain-containing protein [Myxococcota bacterium]MDP6242103.1 polyketide synthase dehydratase domain-containing protein [Myxococcota bacterium]MDP7074100.1 polyketide synthase dehydratase domain-containing protein [Myxococcota bacterium]MDP7299264.1 polyketide synthase dehydratase domain-containing protein [Myxococcota bacterium]
MPLRHPQRSHLFAQEGSGKTCEPIVEDEHRGERRLERRLRVPEDLVFLEGHFAGFPVVPGVVQLGWAIGAAAALLGHPPAVRCLEALKFPTLLRPGDVVRLTVESDGDGRRLRFEIRSADAAECIFASGRCELGGET